MTTSKHSRRSWCSRDASGEFAFVIPHAGMESERRTFLERTLLSLQRQTDTRWIAIIVDDGSGGSLPERWRDDGRFIYHRLPVARGPGAARNVGVAIAASRGCPIILFQDDDDLAEPHRLEATRRAFSEHPGAAFVYGNFVVIDENDRAVQWPDAREDLREIAEALDSRPPSGPDAWKDICTRTGFAAVTSTVAVRTALAVAVPFPECRVSEDGHAWLRMSASGASFLHLPRVLTLYRMDRRRSHQRSRAFILDKIRVDIDAFKAAVVLAVRRGDLGEDQVPGLSQAFQQRLALTVARQGYAGLSESVLRSVEDPEMASSLLAP